MMKMLGEIRESVMNPAKTTEKPSPKGNEPGIE
jgi:hypothetical protein